MSDKDRKLGADVPDDDLSADELLKRLLEQVGNEEREKSVENDDGDPELDQLLRKYLPDETSDAATPAAPEAPAAPKKPEEPLYDLSPVEPEAAGEPEDGADDVPELSEIFDGWETAADEPREQEADEPTLYAGTPDYEHFAGAESSEEPFSIDSAAFDAACAADDSAQEPQVPAVTQEIPVGTAPAMQEAPAIQEAAAAQTSSSSAPVRAMRFRVVSHTKNGVALAVGAAAAPLRAETSADTPALWQTVSPPSSEVAETEPVSGVGEPTLPEASTELPRDEEPLPTMTPVQQDEEPPQDEEPVQPEPETLLDGETPDGDAQDAEPPENENPPESALSDDGEDWNDLIAGGTDNGTTAEFGLADSDPDALPDEDVLADDAPPDESEGLYGDINGDGIFDETDINLMVALGLEDELAKTMGTDAVSRVSRKLEQRGEDAKNAPASAAARATEYVNLSQTREILDEYARVYSGVVFKIIAAAILAVALFLFENLSLFGVALSGPFNIKIYPLVYYMVDIQLLLFSVAVVYRNFFRGLRQLFLLKPTPDSIVAASGLVALIYAIVLCALGVSDGVRLFSFPVAVIAMLTGFYEFFNLRREVLSFNIISSKKPKYALNLKGEDEIRAERKLFSDYIDESSTVARVDRVSFVDGFFARTDAKQDYGSSVLLSLLLPLIAAVVMAMLELILRDGSLTGTISTGVATFLFCLPATVLFTYSVPFYRASKTAYAEDGAIIGTDTLDEFSSTAVLVFDDTEIFRPYGVKVRSVKIFGEHRIDRVIYDTASVFGGLGGLLGEVFRVASGELGASDNVEYREVGQCGISASVDGVSLLAGSRAYLESKEIPLPDAPDDDDPSVSVMYLAVRGEAAAKMYISYDLESDFDYIAGELNDAGICLGVNSTDPNITDEMLKSKMPGNRYPVKVLRRQSKLRKEGDRHASSGIIARGSAKSLLASILLCDKVRHIFRTNLIVKIFSVVIGAVICGLLLFTGNAGNMTSLFAGLYQLLWFIPMFIITRLYI